MYCRAYAKGSNNGVDDSRCHRGPAQRWVGASLLHRLRLAGARHASGASVDSDPLVARLLKLTEPPETRGATPWDLCLKWALYIAPDSKELRARAAAWCDALDSKRAALLATSLPLMSLVGREQQVQANLAVLGRYAGFAHHWSTDRAKPLREAIANGSPLKYEELRAMPWNYA